MIRLAGFAALAWMIATGANAEVRVISAEPDSVSVTIYRDFFALVTETRTVDLPAEAVTLEFAGVVDSLIPQSAVIADTGREVAEANYDFERLSPASLLKKSIGRTVMLMRTNRATGKATQVAATVVSANDGGVVFRTDDGHEALQCSGLPETLTFNEIPGDLKTQPTLSIRLAPGAAGKRVVRVSYIAQGFGWAADYVANVDADSNRMDLRGWLTLRNFTDSRFLGAQVQVVAGRLNLIGTDEGGSSTLGNSEWLRSQDQLDQARKDRLEELESEEIDSDYAFGYPGGCYPYGSPKIASEADAKFAPALQRIAGPATDDELEEVIVTGFRGTEAERENLADYQMYRLPWKTDLGARQTKQVAFLHKPDVKIDRFYGMRIASDGEESRDLDDMDDLTPMKIRIGWNNRKEDGLGEPLPGGIVRVFDRDAEHVSFAGEDSIRDTPVGVPIEIAIGRSPDLVVAVNSAVDEPEPNLFSLLTRRVAMPIDLRVTNARSRAVSVEIRQGRVESLQDLRVSGASLPTKRKSGDYAWRFTVPANGAQELHYKVSGRVPRDD